MDYTGEGGVQIISFMWILYVVIVGLIVAGRVVGVSDGG